MKEINRLENFNRLSDLKSANLTAPIVNNNVRVCEIQVDYSDIVYAITVVHPARPTSMKLLQSTQLVQLSFR